MKIAVIATWGFPGEWYLADYRPAIPPQDLRKWGKLAEWSYLESPITTHSSTTAIVKALIEERSYDVEVLIYGLDSLVAPRRLDIKHIPKDDVCRMELVKYVDNFIHNICSELGHDSNQGIDYAFLRAKAKELLEFMAKKYFEEASLDIKPLIKIVPAVGRFRLQCTRDPTQNASYEVRFSFEGSPLNILTYIGLDLIRRYVLSRKSLDIAGIILDVSHGINYLTLLTKDAVMEFARLYGALKSDEGIKVAVMNSDPVREHRGKSAIHVVEATVFNETCMEALNAFNRDIPRDHSYRMLKRKKVSVYVKRLDSKLRTLRNTYLGVIEGLLKSLDYGIVLYPIYRLSKLCTSNLVFEVNDLVDKAIKAIEHREVNVRKDKNPGCEVSVVHDFALLPMAYVSTAYALYLLKHIASLVINEVTKYGISEGFIELTALEELANYLGLKGVARKLLENELSDIRRRVEALVNVLGLKELEPTVYTVIYELVNRPLINLIGYESGKEVIDEAKERLGDLSKLCEEINERHFYAHAGLERNVIELKYSVGTGGDLKIYVRYTPRCLSKVKDLITKLLS